MNQEDLSGFDDDELFDFGPGGYLHYLRDSKKANAEVHLNVESRTIV